MHPDGVRQHFRAQVGDYEGLMQRIIPFLGQQRRSCSDSFLSIGPPRFACSTLTAAHVDPFDTTARFRTKMVGLTLVSSRTLVTERTLHDRTPDARKTASTCDVRCGANGLTRGTGSLEEGVPGSCLRPSRRRPRELLRHRPKPPVTLNLTMPAHAVRGIHVLTLPHSCTPGAS